MKRSSSSISTSTKIIINEVSARVAARVMSPVRTRSISVRVCLLKLKTLNVKI